MHWSIDHTSGPPALPAGPFLFLLLILCSWSSAQTDSIPSFRLSAGTSYGDIFRQSSDRSRTTVFSRNSLIVLNGDIGGDSLSLQYRSEEWYASADQQRSKFTGSLLHRRLTVTAGYAGMYSLLRYDLETGVPVDDPRSAVQYGILLSTAPFGPLLSASVSFRTVPERYSAGVTFQDFLMPATDDLRGSTSGYSVTLAPVPLLTASIEYEESSAEKDADNTGYSSRIWFHSITKRLSGTYTLPGEFILRAEATTGEYRMDLELNKESLSFGGLSNGATRYVRYSAGASLPDRRMSSEYSFEQFELSGAGGIESWPFTTLAASIIANRFNYSFSGTVKHHALTNTMTAEFSGMDLNGILSYHRILADAALEHWEPEFLVFGRKNFTSDPFSIRDLHLLGIGIAVQLPVMTASVTCSVQQYIPLSVSYRSRTSEPAPGPAPPPAASSTVSTDGGRHASLSVSVPF